jgi:glycopeptide antibiotics resistance protein
VPSTSTEISALPVVVPLAAAAFAGVLWRLHRRAAMSVPRIVVAAIICVYGAGVVANTLFPVYIGGDDSHQSWRVFLNLTPFADINDLLANTLGAPIGYAIFRAALFLVARGRQQQSI